MTADIVNLRQARKQRARIEKDKQAAENRVKHGSSKAERRHEAATKTLETKKLEGTRRNSSVPPPAPKAPTQSD